jgi:D-lactate dehydrogenase
VSYFDAKKYDIESFSPYANANNINVKFHEFRLSADTVDVLGDSQAVCVFVNDKLDARCIEALSTQGIKHIALRCAGFNNVDLDVAKTLGIKVTRVPSYSPHAVAEHNVALLLTLNRKIHRAYNRIRELNFSLNGLVGFDVYGKEVAIVGTGKIGKITAQILKGFGAKILAYDKYPDNEWAAEHGIEYRPLDEILARGHIISLHLPLTKETDHLIDDAQIDSMRRGAVLINTSRGKLVSTKALIRGLKSGKLGGVALDVYEEEEGIFFEDLSSKGLQDDTLSRLLTFPNVLITSHQAFLTNEALDEISRVTAANLSALARGLEALPTTQL